jgi:hypothetical protein
MSASFLRGGLVGLGPVSGRAIRVGPPQCDFVDLADWRRVMISTDGQTIIAVIRVEAQHASGHTGGVTQKLLTFSASAGALLRTLNHIPVHGGYQQVLWASPSAQLPIINGTQPGLIVGSFNLGHSAGTHSDGRFTPIPRSNRTFAAAW